MLNHQGLQYRNIIILNLRSDERAQRWLLSISTSDRAGLLYTIARVLAKHRVNLQLAKISTLGERVEDTFVVDGPVLRSARLQLALETELLDAVAPQPPDQPRNQSPYQPSNQPPNRKA